MVETVRLAKVILDSEPEIQVVDGPLCLGYAEYIAGNPNKCREIIAEFLASVYATASRQREFSTERFVREICQERNIAIPRSKQDSDPAIVLEAARRRYDCYHRPLVESIIKDGYLPFIGQPVTMTRLNGLFYVGDGKNRSSILAAMGQEEIENVRVV